MDLFLHNDYHFIIESIKNIKTSTVINLQKVQIKHDNKCQYTVKDPFYKFYINNNKITKLNTYVASINCSHCNSTYTYKLCKIQKYINNVDLSLQGKEKYPLICYRCMYATTNNYNYIYKNDNTFITSTQNTLVNSFYKTSLLDELHFRNSTSVNNLYRNQYFRKHLSSDEFIKNIKSKIVFIDNKKIDWNSSNHVYVPIVKLETKCKLYFITKFFDVANLKYYDTINVSFHCHNCNKLFTISHLCKLKNKQKILCSNCNIIDINSEYQSIHKIKNLDNEIVYYNTKLELYFIQFLISRNINFENYVIQNISNNFPCVFLLQNFHTLLLFDVNKPLQKKFIEIPKSRDSTLYIIIFIDKHNICKIKKQMIKKQNIINHNNNHVCN